MTTTSLSESRLVRLPIWAVSALAVILARFAARPAKIYLWVTVGLTALSLGGPLAAGATAWSTKLMLALAHLLAAMIVIPSVTRRLSQVTRRS